MNEEQKKKLGPELIRFVIVGIICTALDLGTNFLLLALIPVAAGLWREVVAITSGFIVGVIANYVLSTFFVFRNVADEKRAKRFWFIVLFVVLGAIGLGLNYAIYYAFYYALLPVGYDIDIEFNFTKELWSSGNFWLYVFVFAVKTLIVLVYNYVTRKFIIYRAPKKQDVGSKPE